MKDEVGLSFQKDSEMVGIFNYYLRKTQENGIMRILEQKMGIIPQTDKLSHDIKENGLGYENVAFPFSILLIGILASILLIVIEALRFWKKNKNEHEKYDDTRRSKKEMYTARESEEVVEKIDRLHLRNHFKKDNIGLLCKLRKSVTSNMHL